MARLAAVSVDLDEITHYFGIHGLGEPPAEAASLVYARAVDRLRRFAAAHDLALTWFAVAGDMAIGNNAARLRSAGDAGHEIANHTLDHRYDLTRLSNAEMRRQVESAADVLAAATGQRPRGFRAPGYAVTDQLLSVVRDAGHHYDASVFPCPPYYLAKLVTLGWMRLRRRPSRSQLDSPVVLRAPTRPYRTGQPYWTRGSGLLELPVQVTPGLRLPFIGTALALSGPARSRWLARQLTDEPCVNLELHGIDALDASDGLDALTGLQPDVRIPWRDKLESFAAAVEELRRAGYRFVTMEEAAQEHAGA